MEYAKGKNERIISLLEEIKREHKIDYEIFDVYAESESAKTKDWRISTTRNSKIKARALLYCWAYSSA